jgi:hypothetical protein
MIILSLISGKKNLPWADLTWRRPWLCTIMPADKGEALTRQPDLTTQTGTKQIRRWLRLWQGKKNKKESGGGVGRRGLGRAQCCPTRRKQAHGTEAFSWGKAHLDALAVAVHYRQRSQHALNRCCLGQEPKLCGRLPRISGVVISSAGVEEQVRVSGGRGGGWRWRHRSGTAPELAHFQPTRDPQSPPSDPEAPWASSRLVSRG